MTIKKINHRLKKKHGGKRAGSGRPVGTGKYKSPTKIIRIPISFQKEVSKFIESKCYNIPLYANTVQAGLPAHVTDDNHPETISLNSYLLDHPDDTFLIRANGDSMINAGINSGDLLVVDKRVNPKEGSVVIASINGEFTVKRLTYKNGQPFLMPENPIYKPIPVNESDSVTLFGVVIHSIHSLK